MGGTVASADGVGRCESPFRNDVVHERAAPRKVAWARRTERKSEADVCLPKVVNYFRTWGRYPGWADMSGRVFVRSRGFNRRVRLLGVGLGG